MKLRLVDHNAIGPHLTSFDFENLPDEDTSMSGNRQDGVVNANDIIDEDDDGDFSLLQEPAALPVSQNSSFSIDSGLEEAMLMYEEPSSTAPATKVSSSTSSSLTLTEESATLDEISKPVTITEVGKPVSTFSRTTTFPPRTERRTWSTVSASASSSSFLGKRSASEASISQDLRASKAPRQEELYRPLHDPVLVAYSRSFQQWIAARKLPWGVEWEIARLVSIGKIRYDTVQISALDEFKKQGTNAKAAPLVEKILLRKGEEGKCFEDDMDTLDNHLFANEHRAKFPYDELDLEEESLKRDPYSALGFVQNSDWFGGKVVFRAKLKIQVENPKKPPSFKIELEKAELGASSRFSRRFGSKSFIRIKIPKNLTRYSKELMHFFRRPFIIAGRVFRAFLEKEKNVFFFMTNENSDPGLVLDTVSQKLSIDDFLNWHNPIELNKNQSAAKYASRFALGLSTSAPGLEIEPQNIFSIEDIVSAEGSDMTDGAGFINKAALQKLYLQFKWDVWPTAIQCRIAGAKGMLLLHPSDDSGEPRVFIRPSMNKITYPDQGLDRAQRIIDVLRTCHPRFRCKLSSETIINLAENGVPRHIFTSLLDQTLDLLVTSLTTWDTVEDMANLWLRLSHLGGVFAARSTRRKSGMARVNGYSERDAQENDDEDGLDEADDEPSSTAWWNDEVSGQPSSLEETVMRLIDGGFTPQACPVMRDKLKRILISQINNHVTNFRIEVPMSFTAFILPDPEDVLEEGEVYFKSSARGLLTQDEQYTDVLVGSVVVTRHPCKLPTDAQKWRAVDRPELRHYTDILILSTAGSRRAADWLGGGDYDGDKALCIYQPEIVNSFSNANPNYGDPRDDIKANCFSEHTETVAELLAGVPASSDNSMKRLHALQEYLIGGIRTASLVGQASNMHDFLIYTHGLKDEETIRLAHIFCHTLDGLKTGLKIKPEVWRNDISRYDKGTMSWKESESKGKGKKAVTTARMDNIIVERPSHLRPFIMDQLQMHAKAKGEKEKIDADTKYDSHTIYLDEQLAAPWREQQELAKRAQKLGCNFMAEDLTKIENHVHRMWETHRTEVINSQRVGSFTDLAIETRQDILRKLSRQFASEPNEEAMFLSHDQILHLKASYAYIYDFEKSPRKWTRFPWNVTMRQLTEIKAKATGRSTTVTAEFYERLALKKYY
ncbi:RNA dependent RNA polymerase-domain-containing protein [Lentinula lateritia]|uniref:RNA-dependent RNA polymerase n=1 Tax=Lentinula lateritia TaxID=40482 RepID=A0ABQ8VQI2_9AGAR|nr:RNA dependent RNA polymerase-domain-containing protein [Lentinula lateritia]